MAERIVVYGSNWCHFTQALVRHLDVLGAPYRYVDVDAHPEAEARIAEWNGGRALRPTVDLEGEVLVNPPLPKLTAELKTRGLLPARGEEEKG